MGRQGRPKSILVVHQSADLYGSDRSLLELLTGVDRSEYHFIVCLPEEGRLAYALRNAGAEVWVVPVVKIGRRAFSPKGLARLPAEVVASTQALSRVVGGRRIDLVYTNTLAVFGGAFWAMLHRRPHVWHVRELIRKPRAVSWFLRKAAICLSSQVICNSCETMKWMTGDSGAKGPENVTVIWNGIAPPARRLETSAEKVALRANLGIPADLPVVLMVGRVNAWKGQDLLIEAVDLLAKEGHDQFRVVILGSPPPGQEHFLRQLQDQVTSSRAASRVQLFDFAEDVEPYYGAADVVVVPSKEPEPFGRVAVEAMARGIPVVAAAHGGLVEIVQHGSSGLLFKPNDVHALMTSLLQLLDSAPLRETLGRAAQARYADLFSLDAYRRNVLTALDRFMTPVQEGAFNSERGA
jgi:glycosyltransferase involved in cell wall biosynthesis